MAPPAVRLEGAGKGTLEVARTRLVVGAALFALGFAILSAQLAKISLLESAAERSRSSAAIGMPLLRADIIDRNGIVLATNLETHSLYADSRLIRTPAATAAHLAEIVPGLDRAKTQFRLASDRGFVWIRRHLTPRQAYEINRLGEPGLQFLREQRRVYPQGEATAHLVGFTNVDNAGLAGIEKAHEGRLTTAPDTPLALSLDVRFQHILHQELAAGMVTYSASGAAGIIIDVDTAEVMAMVSLPSFDPNRDPGRSPGDARFNRASHGIYEMGSTFKTFTIAAALDAGIVELEDGYDASEPLHLARFTIRDFHAENRWLSVPEIFMHSSNIGAAKMALDLGGDRQQAFLASFGLLSPAPVALPEIGAPMTPARWRDINTATIGFGHGIAVSPLQLASAATGLVNGGTMRPPTLLLRNAPTPGVRVINPETSRRMRQLLRLAVKHGTGRKADVEGYLVGGKTGTAEKNSPEGYDRDRLLSSFLGTFPIDNPRYVILAVIDEPHGTENSYGYATGGWTAAPVVGHVVARIGPLAGLPPRPEPIGEAEAPPLLITPDGTEIRLASF